MKVIEAEPSSAEKRVDLSPPLCGRRGAADSNASRARRQTHEEQDAPSGWWLVPAVIGGLLFWVWLIRLVVGWVADLF
ncbi:hypothetical protein GVY41_06235 [Frigidibacter albus]|uniref:Uncharacterized protein n=1 Tax=Frigidibacter albus TaxID=1465486 RepID=A0A6L8VE68_9RHOB|nr:hypothetical protein [Frigidibacter albus]MZQ88585.1 hypothetical protein [Frigidibacter albus]NBE30606.1 hypothetical protein [Frigidibacter albus]GGH49308.1 hypothetical protein GCM10011341_11450 [Frigidibacter albus]